MKSKSDTSYNRIETSKYGASIDGPSGSPDDEVPEPEKGPQTISLYNPWGHLTHKDYSDILFQVRCEPTLRSFDHDSRGRTRRFDDSDDENDFGLSGGGGIGIISLCSSDCFREEYVLDFTMLT
jgi:hypothetical protein